MTDSHRLGRIVSIRTFRELDRIRDTRLMQQDQAKYAKVNGQLLRTGHSSGKRVAETYSTEYNTGAVGMDARARVSVNFKRTTRTQPPVQKYTPPKPPEATYVNSDGSTRTPGMGRPDWQVRAIAAKHEAVREERIGVLEAFFGIGNPKVAAVRKACTV